MGALPRHAARVPLLIITALVLALVTAGLLTWRSGTFGGDPSRPRADKAADTAPPTGPSPLGSTRFRIATFNVLGSGHTGPGSENPTMASGVVRMGYTVRILKEQALSVVGFQEMRLDQYDEFNRLTGDGWDVWPERPVNTTVFAQRHIANTLAWRTDQWEATRREFQVQRYINDDSTVNYPVVWLRNKITGDTVIVANFHNVSDKFSSEISGGAQARRNEEIAAEIALAKRLTAENPGVPVFFTGDFNERETTFCKLVGNSPLRAANGGWATPTACKPPAYPLPVDWIFATAPATLREWVKYQDALVRKTTDHPVVMSQVSVPPLAARSSGINRVVVLSVEGLTSGALSRLGTAGSPGFHSLISQGAATYEARPVERPLSLSNVTSMLTGKPINPDIRGHGVIDGTTATSVHQTAGSYVTSILDLVHDRGWSTSLFTSDPGAIILKRSWDATRGAPDTTWTDNGRGKISSFTYDADPGALASKLYQRLTTSPTVFTYAQLSSPDIAGHRYGWSSSQYLAAVQQADRQVRAVMIGINKQSTLKGRTLLIVTSEHGGSRRNHTDPTVLANVRIPFFVWGPGIPPGSDLYRMNPDYRNPGSTIGSYSGWQPIRPSFVANLTAEVLGLPSVPGSTMDTQQNFNIFSTQ